jgi:Zn-dependent peptidase ImmA (M78 family)/transcriptional regulator with XRE-family HTH domain
MAKKIFEVDVNPSILKWARDTIGYEIPPVADHLDVDVQTLINWELGDEKPKMGQLKKMARFYKRPVAVFFLPEIPTEPALPKDFRTIVGEGTLPLSPKLRLIIRKAQRIQTITNELEDHQHNNKLNEIPTIAISDDPERVGETIREKLNVSFKTQSTWETEGGALSAWIDSIEQYGVLILQRSWPIEEARALSFSNFNIPLILLNTKDTIRGRIFSLMHEFTHLLLHDTGICLPERGTYWEFNRPELVNDVKTIEMFCNHVAGTLLVPQDLLMAHKTVKRENKPHLWSGHKLAGIANTFWVSKEVILRRLLICNATSKKYYKEMHEKWKIKEEEAREASGGGARDIPKEVIQHNGAPFASLVINSYHKEKITTVDVADYLDVKLKHLSKLEKLLGAS